MHQVEYDVTYAEEHTNRVSCALRIFYAFPHLILLNVWGQASEVAALIQWFGCVFTGKRSEGLWKFTNSYMDYAARVYSYTALLFDDYPAFGTDPGTVPVQYNLTFEEEANRLTVGLRLIWAIPALIIAAALAVYGLILGVVAWFSIVFTGKMPRGVFDPMVKVIRYGLQANAYVLLLTDKYPAYS